MRILWVILGCLASGGLGAQETRVLTGAADTEGQLGVVVQKPDQSLWVKLPWGGPLGPFKQLVDFRVLSDGKTWFFFASEGPGTPFIQYLQGRKNPGKILAAHRPDGQMAFLLPDSEPRARRFEWAGKVWGPYRGGLSHLVVSPRGAGSACFSVTARNQWELVLDGVPQGQVFEYADEPFYSPKGDRLAFWYKKDEDWFLWENRKSFGPYILAGKAYYGTPEGILVVEGMIPPGQETRSLVIQGVLRPGFLWKNQPKFLESESALP